MTLLNVAIGALARLYAIEEIANVALVEFPEAIAIAQDQGLHARLPAPKCTTVLRAELDPVHTGVDRPQGSPQLDLTGPHKGLTAGPERAEDRERSRSVLQRKLGFGELRGYAFYSALSNESVQQDRRRPQP